ncbi:Pectinesterase/pectinesterase inhibitor PPE8B [Spatholobus suberectus]|nr:Pectinesterase/pectinesterase inhibitor PPE8B [Spatholobus suberectus]
MALFPTKQLTPIPAATFIFFLLLLVSPCAPFVRSDFVSLKVSPSEFIGSVRTVDDVLQNVTSTLKSEFSNVNNDFRVSDAISACLDLLDLSTDELSWSISAVESPQGKHNSTGNLSSDLRTWLSAALANTDTCMDGFEGSSGNVKGLISTGIDQANWLLQKILTQVKNPVLDYFTGSRSSRGKFPSWVDAGDKMLLQRNGVQADAVVATDGTANFTKVMDAVQAAPEYTMKRYVIYIKKGVYNENVEINKKKWNLVMIGDGMDATVITGNLSRTENLTTFRTATFAVNGRGFIARDISFRNTAGPERNQAVALRSNSDLSVFYRCGVSGYQDSLYAHSLRQFYRECKISGTVDFIFGHASAVFQNCSLLVKKGLPNQKNTITAQGKTDPTKPSGFSIQFCNISADYDLLPSVNTTSTYLGRPWKAYSTTIFMQSYISDVLRPEGWLEWNGSLYLDTLYYSEYNNYGPGAKLDNRVKWPGYHMINDSSQALNFTVANLIFGNLWLPSTGDFDLITERRRNEQRKKLRKKILIGVVSAVLLACIVGAAAFVVVRRTGRGSDTKNATPVEQTTAPRVGQNSRLVQMICGAAEYKSKCESTLGEVLKKDPKLEQPKDLVLVSMQLADNEVNKALNQISQMNFASEQEKGAYEDCKQLFKDAKEELGFSITEVGENDVGSLSSKAPELNNWLSAVMSYQQTCIDGFPEGELKNKLMSTFSESKELVSNSLAVVAQVSSFFAIFKGAGNIHLPWLNNGDAPAPAPAPASGLGSDPFSGFAFAPGLSPAPGSAPGPVPSWADLVPTWTGSVPTWAGPSELKGSDEKLTPNVTVAQDGSGKFKTVSEALAAIPETYVGRYVVYVKEGVYDETVTVTKKMVNLTMFGDGMQKSIITGNKNFVDGVRTFQTASFVVLGDGFLGKDMGFRNTAGAEKHQAVAARVQADQAVFFNCAFEGYQDTLYAQTHRQFYRDCVISGTIDFIFGDASAVFQNCTIVFRKPLGNQQNIVTAQGRIDKRENTGFVLQKCVIKADDQLVAAKENIKNYLGRPWKEYSRTIIMETEIGDLIHPDGWLPWEGNFALNTLYYGEYNNNGVGANTNARVSWPGRKVINKDEATRYTVEAFLQGTWINGTGVPAKLGLYN